MMGIPFFTPHGTIDLLDLKPADLAADKIADGLAKTNRFNGTTPVPWSVASHSVVVDMICPPALRGHGLLHDAHEYILGDWVTPAVEFVARPYETVMSNVVNSALDRAKLALDARIGQAWSLPEMDDFEDLWVCDRVVFEAELHVFFRVSLDDLAFANDENFTEAVYMVRTFPKDTEWRAARDLWLDRARELARVGLLRLPAEANHPDCMVQPQTTLENVK